MIRNITVHNYNKDRSQPVTIQCLLCLGLGHRSTDAGRPGWSAPTVLWSRFRIYSSFLPYGFSPTICCTSVNISYRYCLITLGHLGGTPQTRTYLIYEQQPEISYDPHLIITKIRPGFHIYILERSFYLPLYNITMIQHYSRCVIRQLLWLRISDTTCVVWYRFLHLFSPRTMRKLSNERCSIPVGAR